MKIYKYIGPNILSLAFTENESVGFKCSLPKDYNDPFELFQTLDDWNTQPEVIAYYKEILGEVPQRPTSCFSKSPSVIPMWAHYAHQSKGFVIEVDETKLIERFPKVSIGDVHYSDTPETVETQLVNHALMTGKPRHTHLLQRAVFGNSYFTKSTCWSYEQERRVILTSNDVATIDENLIMKIPIECVTALISGPRTTKENLNSAMSITESNSIPLYEMRLGRRTTVPFFVRNNHQTFIHEDGDFRPIDFYCENCGEPTDEDFDEECPWCSLDQVTIHEAARSNPLRILMNHGLYEKYVQDTEEIRRRHRT